MKGTFVALLCAFLHLSLAKEICYEDVGCFSDEPPFNGMPLPMEPSKVQPTWYVYQRGEDARQITSAKELNVDELIVFTHGLAGSLEGTTTWHQPIVESLLKVRPTADILFIDWAQGAAFGFGLKMYSQPATNTRLVGRLLIKFLEGNPLFDSTKAYCVGFSLGAHVCGFAGKASKGGWGRLTALDPAGPLFDKDHPMARVDKQDAAFVDVIHTSWVGLQRPVGHVDFFANGAKRQPGCLTRRRRSAEAEHPSGRPLPYDYVRPGRHFENKHSVHPGRQFEKKRSIQPERQIEDERSVQPGRQFENKRSVYLERQIEDERSVQRERQFEDERSVQNLFLEDEHGIMRDVFDWVADFFGCSHYRGPAYFEASILDPQQCSFFFCPCDGKDDFDNGKCNECKPAEGQFMGYPSVDFPNHGSFWGKTGQIAPFCE